MSSLEKRKRGTRPKEGDSGFLDTSKVSGDKPRKIWVVKVPEEFADAIDKAEAGDDLGKLHFDGKGEAGKKLLEIDDSLYPPDCLAPMRFELSRVGQSEDSTISYGVSWAEDGTDVRAEGTVTHSYILKPPLDSNSYSEYARKRNKIANINATSRKAQAFDGNDQNSKARVFEPKRFFVAQTASRLGSSGVSSSSSSSSSISEGGRLTPPLKEYEGDELKQALFRALNEAEFTLKDLRMKLACREDDLRKLLHDKEGICVKEKKGNKTFFKLHPNYIG